MNTLKQLDDLKEERAKIRAASLTATRKGQWFLVAQLTVKAFQINQQIEQIRFSGDSLYPWDYKKII
jgi:hypothetical protein